MEILGHENRNDQDGGGDGLELVEEIGRNGQAGGDGERPEGPA